MTQSAHETFTREEKVMIGSERSFGIVMATGLAVFGMLNWWHEGRVWPWLGGIAIVLIFAAYLWPTALKPLNWLWFKFGLLLHSVVNPIVMALLFYAAV